MNGYERIKAALAGKAVDATPVMLHNFQVAAFEAGLNMDQFRESPALAAEAFIAATEKYNLDGVLIDFDTATLAAAAGCRVRYPADLPAQCHGAALGRIEDIHALPAVDLLSCKNVVNWLETVRRVCEYFQNEIYIRGNCDQAPFSLASMIRGPQDFMLDLVDDENQDNVHQLLAYAAEVTGGFVELMSQTGAHCVSNGDSVAGPSMISPEMYERYGLPYEKRIAQLAHDKNMDYMLHICGDATGIVAAMLQTGADALELDYQIDLKAVEAKLRGRASLSGIVDPSGVMALGSPEMVRSAVRDILAVFAGNTRLILCSGCSLPRDTPEENMRAFVAEAKGASVKRPSYI